MTTHEIHERCRRTTAKALKNGIIRKPERCQKCLRKVRSKNLHGHHADYAKPFQVDWLCSRCHRRLHAFLNWFRDCMGWLDYCATTGIRPEEGNLPIHHKKTGKQMKSTWFQYWKQHERKR